MIDDYLIIHHNLYSKGWNCDTALGAIAVDKYYKENEVARKKAYEEVGERLLFHHDKDRDRAEAVVDYVGNKEILYAPNKVSLVCHRNDLPFYEEQAQAVLFAAQCGAVVVSAFVSEKEREIRNRLMQEGFPVVEVISNGFASHYRPYGNSYDACIEGNLVQITPWTFCHRSEYKLTREMCLVMNQLVRVICKVDDDWWKNL